MKPLATEPPGNDRLRKIEEDVASGAFISDRAPGYGPKRC